MKLGALQDEYIVAIKLSTDCSWLSFPSIVWQLLVRVIDCENTMSNCCLHSFDTNLFDRHHPLVIKHRVLASVIKNCYSGSVCCELVCQIKNDFINRCLVVPLSPIKLNALYFVKAEKLEKIAVMNPMEYRHKYVFKFPEYLTLLECLTILINKNKHRMSKSLLTNITSKLYNINCSILCLKIFIDGSINIVQLEFISFFFHSRQFAQNVVHELFWRYCLYNFRRQNYKINCYGVC